jgi:hypothetical protein
MAHLPSLGYFLQTPTAVIEQDESLEPTIATIQQYFILKNE